MSVHIDDVLMARKPETLEKIKQNIELKFNIQDSGEIKKFIRVYYEWIRDTKGSHAKMTMVKDIKKLVEGYKEYTGSDAKVHKTPITLLRL